MGEGSTQKVISKHHPNEIFLWEENCLSVFVEISLAEQRPLLVASSSFCVNNCSV